jgi:adenylate cyclase
MALGYTARRNLRDVISVALAGSAIGILISYIIGGSEFTYRAALNGIIIGALVGGSIVLFEGILLRERLRRMRFTNALLLRTFVQVCIITYYAILTILVYNALLYNIPLSEALSHPNFLGFIRVELIEVILYSIVAGFLLNFTRQTNRMLGQGSLFNVMTGKYAYPKEETRIFMFSDLESSTTIAEKIGNIQYHRFLDDYYFDITQPIVECSGEIYQYIGDEIVVTWKLNKGLRNADCIRCFFEMQRTIASKREIYLEKHGYVPGFKAGYHVGMVITGEIGDIKKEIVFNGDVVNTAARIQAQCKELKAPILISGELLKLLDLSNDLSAEGAGSFLLKGKENEVELFRIFEK